MKAVLVVDMPDCCANCTLMVDDIAGEYCNAHDDDYIDIPDVTDGKPNWCPLMELPEQWEIELTQHLAEVYMLKEKTERQLEEVYQSRKPYLNQKDSCEELHEMCRNCDIFCGTKNHDYSECRNLACFKNWLGLEYLDWVNGYQDFVKEGKT